MLSVFATCTFILSKAFVDFSTSGLETALTHLLIASFALTYFMDGERKLGYASMLAGLAVLNRIDITLIVGPPLLYLFLTVRGRPVCKALTVIVGFIPFIAWRLFALFYYGFLLPNTYYSKVGIVGVARTEFIVLGLGYFKNSLIEDPLTLAVISAALLIMAFGRKIEIVPFAVSMLAYMAYTVYLGGDFMSGRYLTPPLIVAVIIIARSGIRLPMIGWAAVFGCILTLAFLAPMPTLLSGVDYGGCRDDENLVSDERGCYYPYSGLLRNDIESYIMVKRVRRQMDTGQKAITLVNLGFAGYYAGPDLFLICPGGITEPFMSHLPARGGQRAGHHLRKVPLGYRNSIMTGKNRLRDPDLREYYEVHLLVTRGELFDGDRLKAIIDLNMGRYDHHIANYAKRLKDRGEL